MNCDWNDLPMGREFDGKFLKNVKSPSHAPPTPPLPASLTIIVHFPVDFSCFIFVSPRLPTIQIPPLANKMF